MDRQRLTFKDLQQELLVRQKMLDAGTPLREIIRLTRANQLISLRRGIYVRNNFWNNLKPHEQYQLQILAYNALGKKPVFSHVTAAVIHGLAVSQVPRSLHIYTAGKAHGRAHMVERHALLQKDTHVEQLECGLHVTGIRQTLADCAKTLPLREAVAIGDSVIYRNKLYHGEVVSTLESLKGKGSRKAKQTAKLISKYAESPGESHVRLLLEEMGLRYREQINLDIDGARYRVDFMLLDFPIVIEFDGKIKVTDFGPADEILFRERVREVNIQNSGLFVFRTNWRDTVIHPQAFISKLSELIRTVERNRTEWLISEGTISLVAR